MERKPELTDAGRTWAEGNSEVPVPSMSAIIALQGYESTWPHHHVATAIEACNAMAKREES